MRITDNQNKKKEGANQRTFGTLGDRGKEKLLFRSVENEGLRYPREPSFQVWFKSVNFLHMSF